MNQVGKSSRKGRGNDGFIDMHRGGDAWWWPDAGGVELSR